MQRDKLQTEPNDLADQVLDAFDEGFGKCVSQVDFLYSKSAVRKLHSEVEIKNGRWCGPSTNDVGLGSAKEVLASPDYEDDDLEKTNDDGSGEDSGVGQKDGRHVEDVGEESKPNQNAAVVGAERACEITTSELEEISVWRMKLFLKVHILELHDLYSVSVFC
jgi:hypothetical protein